MNTRIGLRIAIMVGTFLLAMMVGLLLLNHAPPVLANGPNSLFVKVNGSGSACSQTAPCELATALTRARDGDIIYLAEGVYTDDAEAVISTTLSITIYGGWDGAPSGPVVRNPQTYPTILDGEKQRRVVYLQGPSSVVLDGFTITNGRVSSASSLWQGAGLYAKDVDLTLRNMTFSHNILDTFDQRGPRGYGGGAHVERGALVVDHVTFSLNKSWSQIQCFGGGLSVIEPTSVQISNSAFYKNDAWQGGGLYVKGKATERMPLTMTNTIFKDNGWGDTEGRGYSGYGSGALIIYAQALLENTHFQNNRSFNDIGALYLLLVQGRIDRATFVENQGRLISALFINNRSHIQVANTVIANNRSTSASEESGAIKIQSSQATFLHASIAYNEANAGLLLQNASVAITNTILVSHTVGISVPVGSTATLDHTLWGAGAWANGRDWSGDGEITSLHDLYGDPAFVDPDAGDFHIRMDSAARDAGTDMGLYTDIDGDPRPFGPAPDIGADEWLPQAWFYIPYVLKEAEP